MIRLFIGIGIDPSIRRLLSCLGSTIPGARTTSEDQIHLTLRFIGEADGNSFADIKEGLGGLEVKPLTLQVKGIGHFPPRGKPRVVWADVDPAGDVIILRNKVNYLLSLCGVERKQRKFHPHITLARLKDSPPKRVASFLTANALLQSPPFTVNCINLYSSSLRAKGAIHRVEASYPLLG